jgi:Domain of unknown function (DUF3067)
MNGLELREIIRAKWGYSYDVQIRKTGSKIFLQVMWKYQEQASFPLSEEEYLTHLDTVAAYLTSMGSGQQIRDFVEATKEKPRLGKAVSILLDLGDRASEWIV